MPTFEEFVQTELPKRPFVNSDGLPGQVPVRSSDPTHPNELVYVTISGVTPTTEINLEAGEDLLKGTPVKVLANKFYAADQATDPNVVGLVKDNVLTAELATAVVGGSMSLSGLAAGSPYFLGAGVITTVAPSTGYVVRLGMAVTSGVLLVNIEEPIYLS